MPAADAGSTPDPRISTTPPAREETVAPVAAPAAGRSRSVIFATTCALALLAGGAAWVVGEKYLNYYAISHEAESQPYGFAALRREKLVVDSRNAAIAFGTLGSLLGLGLGLAGGLARRSILTGLAGAFAGTILGGAAGAGLSFLMVPYYLKTVDPMTPTLLLPLITHGVIWTGIGTAAGLAFGLGAGRANRILAATFGGAVGGMLGTAAFEVYLAFMHPLLPIDEFMGPTAGLRLGAILTVALFTAAGAVGQELVSLRRVNMNAV